MVHFIGDQDWTRKVRSLVPLDVRQEVHIIQLDREEMAGKGYSSVNSVIEAHRLAATTNGFIILVGSCPESDYRTTNSELWDALPAHRTFFFDSTQGSNGFQELLTQISAQP